MLGWNCVGLQKQDLISLLSLYVLLFVAVLYIFVASV